MAPGYRSSNRRHNRSGLTDHDMFEGLPVKSWRRGLVLVEPSIAQEISIQQNDIWAIELPHEMPKDSHLLPQHSQELLRAARSGKIYKLPTTVEEEETDPEVTLDDKIEKKEELPQERGFIAKAWKQVPRNLKGPDIEFLAKRRKGLITAATGSTSSSEPTLIKSKVKKIDAAGNEYFQDTFVPLEKQASEEVISSIPDQNLAAENLIDHRQSTLSKRKGPFRKKIKAAGRAKKKKLLPPTSTPGDSVFGTLSNTQTNSEMSSENDFRSILVDNEIMDVGELSGDNSEDGEGEDGEDNEEEDETNENQSLSSPASKALSGNHLEDRKTENLTRFVFPVDPEKVTTSCKIKDDRIDSFTNASPSGPQLTKAVSPKTSSVIKNVTLTVSIDKVERTTSQETVQTPHEAESPLQKMQMPT